MSTTFTVNRPLSLEFQPAHYNTTQLKDVVSEIAKDFALSDSQISILTETLENVALEDNTLACPIFNEASRIQETFGLFMNTPTPTTSRNFLLYLFGTAGYQNIADASNNTELNSIVLSDFKISDSGIEAIFEITGTTALSKDEAIAYLDGQISDGWGENGTPENKISIDIREAVKETFREVSLRYEDVLLSSPDTRFLGFNNPNFKPVWTSERIFDENDKLILDDEEFIPFTRQPNAITVSAFIHSRI